MYIPSSAELWAYAVFAPSRAVRRVVYSPHLADVCGRSRMGYHGPSRTGFGRLLGAARPYVLGRRNPRATFWPTCCCSRRSSHPGDSGMVPRRSMRRKYCFVPVRFSHTLFFH
ncbi:unnamed protein product [Laminaria digitata]